MLKIENLNVHFGDFHALKDVSLEIPDGEFFTLLGPSGCGKTTMLRLIAGFIMPTTGQILMNGTEFESVWLGHQFSRHCADNDLRREIAMLRRIEQQQQKRIAALKPADESLLEHTIGYEQLAVDLTAIFAQRESDKYVKMAMDFALLEDFDHLYR